MLLWNMRLLPEPEKGQMVPLKKGTRPDDGQNREK